MFFLSVPKTCKVGDTFDCRINREPARVTWCDRDHLVIEPNDVRLILGAQESGDLCTSSAATTATLTPEATRPTYCQVALFSRASARRTDND